MTDAVDRRPVVLQVSTYDRAGGAEKVAMTLLDRLPDHGIDAWMAVGQKRTDHPRVVEIPNDASRSIGSRLHRAVDRVVHHGKGRLPGFWKLGRWTMTPKRRDRLAGREHFDYPGTGKLLELVPRRPDIVHCHNLHGGYFDLRELPGLSRRVPVLLTLHDAWMLAGHCTHSLDCTRWKQGCGACPYLDVQIPLRADGTAENWQAKADIFERSRLYVAASSEWLHQRARQSMLARGVVDSKTITNGVDLDVFKPGDRDEARSRLGLEPDKSIILFAANAIRSNALKDFETLRGATARVAEAVSADSVRFIALGQEAMPEEAGRASIEFVPYQSDPSAMADYYRAADLYVHAARAEAWGLTVSEALACGTPVVATAVGGIPEQVVGLDLPGFNLPEVRRAGPDQATGVLVPVGDEDAMSRAMQTLLDDDRLRQKLGHNAAEYARAHLDVDDQVDAYATWYGELSKTTADTGSAVGGEA